MRVYNTEVVLQMKQNTRYVVELTILYHNEIRPSTSQTFLMGSTEIANTFCIV